MSDFDLTGKLLISTPAMGDPRFANSVILICAYGDEGAFGVVVNRALSRLRMAQVFEQIGIDLPDEAAEHPVIGGGPVEAQRGFVLHDGIVGEDEAAQAIAEGLVLSASTEILRTLGGPEAPSRWLLALGYAGWGAGQLEEEIMQNAWLTCPAQPDLIFDQDPGEHQWVAALNSLGVDPITLSAVAGRA